MKDKQDLESHVECLTPLTSPTCDFVPRFHKDHGADQRLHNVWFCRTVMSVFDHSETARMTLNSNIRRLVHLYIMCLQQSRISYPARGENKLF